MTRILKILFIVILACICQTNFAQMIRIADVAPDMLTVFLVVLTSHMGTYGGFCAGAVLAMLYDASVGYVLAINLVGYTFIGWAASVLRGFLNTKFKKLKHKSILVMMLICFFLTAMREMLYIGYLFLIGSEQSMVTVMRALLCSAYSALLVWPCTILVARLMRRHPSARGKQADMNEESDAARV